MKFPFVLCLLLTFGLQATAQDDASIFLVASKEAPLVEVVDKRGSFEKKRASALAGVQIMGLMFQNLMTKVRTAYRPRNTHVFIKPSFSVATGQYTYLLEDLPWNCPTPKENKGLYLFIHGWRGHPQQWHDYLVAINKLHLGVYCLAPYVPCEGNCSLEQAAEPFLCLIRDYASKNPGKPITLIGTSNGGRIALYLENRLSAEELKGRTLSVVSLAGLHYGTRFVNDLADWSLLWTSQMDHHVAKDFAWKSETARRCLHEWRAKQLIWKEYGIQTRHLFCASTEDGQIYPPSCSLPLPPAEASGLCNYCIYKGENHLSIVPAACRDVLEWLGN